MYSINNLQPVIYSPKQHSYLKCTDMSALHPLSVAYLQATAKVK